MSKLFFNNAQMEKYEALEYILSFHGEIKNKLDSKKMAMDRHRIRTINKDLKDCNLSLCVKPNLTYNYTSKDIQQNLIAYHNKKTLNTYYCYLLKQSNLFHLISYLVKNKRPTLETAAEDLSISNSYIYKLIVHFNEVSEPKYGVTIEIIKKRLTFIGKEEKLIVALFSFYSIAPQAESGVYMIDETKREPFLSYLRPYMLSILQKSDKLSDAELLFELYKSLYTTLSSANLIESIGYDLIRTGGPLISSISKLVKYFSRDYDQIQLKELSFYLPELIKLIVLSKVSTKEKLFKNTQELNSEDECYSEIIMIERIFLEEDIYIERRKIKAILNFVKRILDCSRNLVEVKIYVNIVESGLLSYFYQESVTQLFNERIITVVHDIDQADIIITDNKKQVIEYNNDKYVYIIQNAIEEFEKKDYLQFIMIIVEQLSKL